MATTHINRVVLTGNLTKDPELRSTSSSTPVCSLRVASNSRRKTAEGWADKVNYFDVTVWGAQAETATKFLKKGRPVAIDGRLDWREWTDDKNVKHQAVQIIAETVQFLGTPDS